VAATLSISLLEAAVALGVLLAAVLPVVAGAAVF